MANTIPEGQCPTCAQCIQIGCVLFTVIWNVLSVVVVVEPARNPDEKPPERAVQGVSREPWVTEWLEGKKWKVTVSPATTPDTWSGVYVKPFCPTLTAKSAA